MDITAEVARIAGQEQRLQFDRFDAETAWKLGSALRLAAGERDAPVAIDVFAQGRVLFHSARRGATPDNAEWVRRKRNLVLRYFRSSYAIGLELARDGQTLEAKHGLTAAEYMAHGGSFPLLIRGTGCIGAVTVSGLPQRDDHAMVVRALAQAVSVDPAEVALES